MDQNHSASGRGRRDPRGRGRNCGRSHQGPRDTRSDMNSAMPANPQSHRNYNTRRDLGQRLDDVAKQLEEKQLELTILNKSYETLRNQYNQSLAELDLLRERHKKELTLMKKGQENMKREFKEKEAMTKERMADLNTIAKRPRSFNDPDIMKFLDENAEFFYELLRYQVAKTEALREELAAVTQENAELRAHLDSLGDGASE
ncbi:hypothetical protein F5Y05DRAFT_411979 [Hypoxylon sp. FL0543]|nr:hypothetical protein F5Y05DRAFT_411979 [Hypoxylon sp. FL0543]